MDLKQGYFEWLCAQTGLGGTHGPSSYSILLRELHKSLYFSTVGNDQDRATDGKALREPFGGVSRDMGECTVLEMLVAFAMRIDIWLNGGTVFGQRLWLYTMLHNLGLDTYDDDRCAGDPNAVEEIRSIVERWLSRQYRADGLGGIFPLRNPVMDQRKVELWYQLQGYLHEHYEMIGEDSEVL